MSNVLILESYNPHVKSMLDTTPDLISSLLETFFFQVLIFKLVQKHECCVWRRSSMLIRCVFPSVNMLNYIEHMKMAIDKLLLNLKKKIGEYPSFGTWLDASIDENRDSRFGISYEKIQLYRDYMKVCCRKGPPEFVPMWPFIF